MSPTDATQPTPQRWNWLDRWFEARWHGLLTWAILTLAAVAVMEFHPEWVDWAIERPAEVINRLLPTPLPQVVLLIARSCNFVFLLTWFEPLVLRLNWARGLAWIALRMAPFIFGNFLSLDGQVYERITFFVVSSCAQVLVLRGRRSRPWMCLVSVMLAITAIGFAEIIPRNLQNRFGWLGFAALMVIYAVPLLYGTRLLRPEERALAS